MCFGQAAFLKSQHKDSKRGRNEGFLGVRCPQKRSLLGVNEFLRASTTSKPPFQPLFTIATHRACRYSNPPPVGSNDKDGCAACNPRPMPHRVSARHRTHCEVRAVAHLHPRHSTPEHAPARLARQRSCRDERKPPDKHIRSQALRTLAARHHPPHLPYRQTKHPPLPSSRASRRAPPRVDVRTSAFFQCLFRSCLKFFI